MRDALITGLALALLVLAAWGVAQEQPRRVSTTNGSATLDAPLASTNKLQAADRYSVIGYLEKRDRVITIKSGPQGPVYSVATKEGKTLFENLSPGQLKAQAPEIHDFIRGAMAADASGRGTQADARLKISALH
jgi:hypothetical protein